MGMLTKEDLKQIGEVMDDKLVDALGVVNKGFSGMQRQFDDLKKDVSGLKKDVTEMKAVMVTKSYLDDKLADLKSDLVANDRKLEKKTDVLIDALSASGTLASPDLERLEQARVFPRIVP